MSPNDTSDKTTNDNHSIGPTYAQLDSAFKVHWPTNVLVWLGGAKPKLLKFASADSRWFVPMGVSLLVTACFAGVGAYVAVSVVLNGTAGWYEGAYVRFAAAWAIAILAIDWLILRIPVNQVRFRPGVLDEASAALESTGTDDAISILTRDGSTRWSPWQLVTTSLQFAPRLFIAIATSFLIAESLLFVFFPKQIQARTDYITSTETKAAIDQGKATGQAQSGSAQQKIDDLKKSIDPSWWEGQQKLKPNPDAPASDLAAVVGLQTAAEYWGSDCAAAKDFMAKEYNGDEYTVSGFHFDAKAYNTSKTNFTFGVENPNYAAAVDLVRRMCGGSDSVNSVTTAWSGYTGEQVYDQGEYRAKAEYDRVSADVQDRDKLLEANPKLVELRAQLGTSMEATQKNASDAQSNIQQIAKDFGTLSAALDSFISDQTPQTIEPNPAPPCLGNIAQEALCRVTRYFNYPSPNGLTAGMLRILFLSIELMPVLAKLAFSVRRRRPYETLAAAYEVINEGAQVKLVSEHLVRIGGSIESDSHMRRALRSVSTADMMDAELALASQRRYWRGWILALPTSRRRLRGWLHWVNEPDDPTAHMPPPSQRAGSEPLRQDSTDVLNRQSLH